jgi:cell division protein FtsZ
VEKDQNGTHQKDEKRGKLTSIQDSELESVLSSHKTVIKVVGTGGAGNNTLTRMAEVGVEGVEAIAVNTDAQDLLFTKAPNKLLIGRNMTHGLGAGSDPKIGEDSALENQEDIKAFLEGSDMVFVTCGLGGGTGTGSAPVIADIAKNLGALTIAVVTVPFTEEGYHKLENAASGLEKLRKSSDTVIVVQNDRLLDIVPDLPLNAAFKIADEILVNAVKGITELVTKKGLINLDFADVKAIMKNGDTAMIGIGESSSENKATDAVEKAVMNPLLDVDILGARSALINITGDANMSIREARSVMIAVAEKLDPKAKIIWGANIDENLNGSIRVLLIATGVRSGSASKMESKLNAIPNKVVAIEKEEITRFDIKDSHKFETNDFEEEELIEKKVTSIPDTKNKKVFTEIFEEEIRGDVNVLSETVRNLDYHKKDVNALRNILNACTSLQSSSQLFNFEKLEEFSIFVADIVEGILSDDIPLSEPLVTLMKKMPSIIEGMSGNHKVALQDAQDFIQNLTKIIDNSSNNKKKTDGTVKRGPVENKNIISDDITLDQEDLKKKLKMDLY